MNKTFEARSLARLSLTRLSVFAALVALFTAGHALAVYIPDASIAPSGAIDVTVRGDALVAPAALNRSVDGNGFVTIARSERDVVICAFTAGGTLQPGFGSAGDGCDREALGSTEIPYQLLTGKTGYWLLIADTSNAARLTLLRLTTDGRPDSTYGTQGRRAFVLGCDATDDPSRCPQLGGGGTQQVVNARAFIAETGASTLWLMAARKSSTAADEGVVYRIDRGSSFATRANAFDTLPAAWQANFQSSVTMPVGIVAFGDGVLLEHRTNNGYVMIHVDASGAIDRAFGGQGYATTGGDAALPAETYSLPIVAADNTFLWGIPPIDPRSRNRYDASGHAIGTMPMPAIVYGISIAPTVPATFTTASTPLWIWDGTRIGRWVNGQWDMTAFGGQGTYQPPTAQTIFMLTRDETTLAMTDSPTRFAGTPTSKLTLLDTRAAAQPRIGAVVVRHDSMLAAQSFRSTIDPTTLVRWAMQADGSLVWQTVDFDPRASTPSLATGVLAASTVVNLSSLMISAPSSRTGERWVVRTHLVDARSPVEFYADLSPAGGAMTPATPVTPRRINMNSIRAMMPTFTPTAPFSNPTFLNVDIADDGSASALILFARGTLSAFSYNLARVTWTKNVNTAGEYVATLQWAYDVGGNYFTRVQRDGAGRLLLTDTIRGSVTRLRPDGGIDGTFGQAGRVDLFALGFTTSEISVGGFPSVKLDRDDSLWIATVSRLVHLASSGVPTASVASPRAAPALNGAINFTAAQFVLKDALVDSAGSALVVYANAQQYRILRYTVTGELDAAFGLNGADSLAITSAPSSPLTGPFLMSLSERRIAVLIDNTVVVHRLDATRPGPRGTVASAIEFYNAPLDHYFVSADAIEIAGIEAGAAGPGWQRTGQSFQVYATLADAPGGALELCRFYGSAVPLASSPNGRTGPNSHFYTLAGAECDSVYNKDKAWQYEGPRLALMPLSSLAAGGTCGPEQQPVYRAYNNGYQFAGGVWMKNDSNHRYSTSRATIAGMVGKGWSDEGAVFCVPH